MRPRVYYDRFRAATRTELTRTTPMHLLFDLDGTLTNSREGIVRCIQHALGDLDRPIPPAAELARYIGPPLPASFELLLETSDSTLIERAMAAYRERFERVGIFENVLFPGVSEALATLESAGDALWVVTAKPTVYACRILEQFGIAGRFRAVNGPDLHERNYTKESLIHDALIRHQISREAMMIGDRGEDVIGAKINGLRSIAVAWGYGSKQELEATEPDYVVNSASELLDVIERKRGEMSGAKP